MQHVIVWCIPNIYTAYLLGKFGPKIQYCQFKLEFGTFTNSNIQNSMVMFDYSVGDRKYLFWKNLVQKIKIVSLSWNLVHKLIRICTIQWWCFAPEIHFFGKLGSKIQNYLFNMAHIQCQNLLNKLIHLSNKINQFFLINKTSLWLMVRSNTTFQNNLHTSKKFCLQSKISLYDLIHVLFFLIWNMFCLYNSKYIFYNLKISCFYNLK